MDLKKILDITKEVDITEENQSVELYLIRKGKTDEYFTFELVIEEKIQNDLLGLFNEAVETIQNRQVCEYNPLGQLDGHIETCKLGYIQNAEKMLTSINEKGEYRLDKLPKIKDIHSYCIKLNTSQGPIFAFRRFNKLRQLRAGFIGMVFEGRFKSLGGELIGLYSDIDIILKDDDVFIINHISLERIFDIEDQFKAKAKETIQDIRGKKIIKNFDKFEEDALNNLNVVKRLTKIKENETLPKVFDNFNNVPKVIEHFGLNIKLNESQNKIIYEDKTQIEDITLLMNDSYYETIIAGVPGIDKLK